MILVANTSPAKLGESFDLGCGIVLSPNGVVTLDEAQATRCFHNVCAFMRAGVVTARLGSDELTADELHALFAQPKAEPEPEPTKPKRKRERKAQGESAPQGEPSPELSAEELAAVLANQAPDPGSTEES